VGVLPFRARREDDRNELARLLHGARTGDSVARNDLISAYVPFILRIASQTTRRYIDPNIDDEYSISLSAFNEAIDRYQEDKAASFLTFAETVIRRRLIDFFRSQRQHRERQLPWSEFDVVDDEDNNLLNWVEVSTSLEVHQLQEETAIRGLEIEEYSQCLEKYDLTFAELVEISPRHEDARRNAFDCAKVIREDPSLLEYVERRQALPLKALEDRVQVSRKTLERQRKYILAILVLMTGDFPLLQSFLMNGEGGQTQ
jgi:RNA polymerase sigma-I factor